jgi:hypothetical protein
MGWGASGKPAVVFISRSPTFTKFCVNIGVVNGLLIRMIWTNSELPLLNPSYATRYVPTPSAIPAGFRTMAGICTVRIGVSGLALVM